MDLNNEELKKDLEEQYAILEEEVEEDKKKKRFLVVFLFFLFIFLGIFGSTFSYIRLYNGSINVEKDNILLKDLDVINHEGILNYSPNIHKYVIELPHGTKKISFKYLLGNNDYKITITGNDNLKTGLNTVTIVVEDEDGNKEEYIVYVYVMEDDSNVHTNLSLIELDVSNHTLNKEFKPYTTTYIVNNVKNTEDSVEIGFRVKDPSAHVNAKLNGVDVSDYLTDEGNGKYSIRIDASQVLNLGANKLEIILSDDEGNKKTYNLFINVVSESLEPSVIEIVVDYGSVNGKYLIEEITPGWESSERQKFTITNDSNYDAYVDVDWTNVKNNFVNKEDLEYTLFKENSKIKSGILPSTDENITKTLLIPAHSKINYYISYKYIYRDTDQNIDQGKLFSTVVKVSISK